MTSRSSPLKIEIPSKNMREKPTNTPIIHSVYLLCMVAPTCFGITLPFSGSVPSAFLGMLNWVVDRILWMGVLCLVTWCAERITSIDTKHHNIHNILSTAAQLSISQKTLGTLPEDGNVMPKHTEATI